MNDRYSMERQTLWTVARMDSLARRLHHRGELALVDRMNDLAHDLDAYRTESLMGPSAGSQESDSHVSGNCR